MAAITRRTGKASDIVGAARQRHSTAPSQMPAVAERGNYDTPAEWGKLKQETRDGHNKTYEREFNDGAKLVTFVGMVEPEDQPKQEKKEIGPHPHRERRRLCWRLPTGHRRSGRLKSHRAYGLPGWLPLLFQIDAPPPSGAACLSAR